MAIVEPNETTLALAQLARPGVNLPSSRYDQFIKRSVFFEDDTSDDSRPSRAREFTVKRRSTFTDSHPEDLRSTTQAQDLFSITLKGLGYLDENSNQLLVEEAVRLNGYQILSPSEAEGVLRDDAEIVLACKALYLAVGDRYDRMFDIQLQEGRVFSYGAVATAKLITVEISEAAS